MLLFSIGRTKHGAQSVHHSKSNCSFWFFVCIAAATLASVHFSSFWSSWSEWGGSSGAQLQAILKRLIRNTVSQSSQLNQAPGNYLYLFIIWSIFHCLPPQIIRAYRGPHDRCLDFFSPGSLRWSNLSFEPEDRSPPSVENDAHRHGTTVSKANGLASLLKFVAGKKCAEVFGPMYQCSGRLSKETLHSGIYIYLYTTYVHTCIIHIYICLYL